MPQPVRMQVSRKAGFNLQEASHALNGLPAKLVTRPGPWGNPFSIDEVAKTYGLDRAAAQAKAVAMASDWLRGTIRRELGGHNLACWCKPGTPCHADVLIELAND
jgi:hypothetical protein